MSNLIQPLVQETLSPTTNAYANPSSKMVIHGGGQGREIVPQKASADLSIPLPGKGDCSSRDPDEQ